MPKKNNKKGKKQSKKGSKPKSQMSGTPASECATHYATAIGKPFSHMARGACIPVFPAISSQRYTTYTKVTMTVGAGGYGFVNVIPALANNKAHVHYSSSTSYGGTGATINQATTAANTTQTPTVTPYTSAQLQPFDDNEPAEVRGRIVAVGIRSTYIGKASDMSGVTIVNSMPAHLNANGQSFDTNSNMATANIVRVSNRPVEFGFAGIAPEEFEYGNTSEATNAATIIKSTCPWSNSQSYDGVIDTTLGGSPIQLLVQGAVVGSTFLIEVVQHLEYIGKLAARDVRPVFPDSEGFTQVNAAAQRAQDAHSTSETWLKSFTDQVVAGGRSVGNSAFGRSILNSLGRVAAGYVVGGPAAGSMAMVM